MPAGGGTHETDTLMSSDQEHCLPGGWVGTGHEGIL